MRLVHLLSGVMQMRYRYTHVFLLFTAIKCDPASQCASCVINDRTKCLSCKNGDSLKADRQGKRVCVTNCGEGYISVNGVCEECESKGCSECPESPEKCTKCKDGYLYIPDKNSCTKQCDAAHGYYADDSKCLKCADAMSGCIACDSESKCTKCDGSLFLGDDGKCLDTCSEGDKTMVGLTAHETYSYNTFAEQSTKKTTISVTVSQCRKVCFLCSCGFVCSLILTTFPNNSFID